MVGIARAAESGPLFTGPVEADETYVGGKLGNMSVKARREARNKPDLGKSIVVGAKDRASNAVSARVVEYADKPTVQGFIGENTAEGATVYTDEGRAYQGMDFDHDTVNHCTGEYVRGMAHTNGIESFWSMLKRAHKGVHHKLSDLFPTIHGMVGARDGMGRCPPLKTEAGILALRAAAREGLQMRFFILAFAFASVATLFAPPAATQSVETCIAYMEADAAYEAARREAVQACNKATYSYDEACRLAREHGQEACDQAIDDETLAAGRARFPCFGPIERNSPECQSLMAAVQAAELRTKAACQEIWAACDRDARRDACRSAKQPVLDAAGEIWGRAYGLAYQGPGSDIPSVFEKLVLADRDRCRERFE